MRIVAGRHKGRPLNAPQGRATRPTSDRAREAMFNVLAHLGCGGGLNGARVLDLFAGTGALGLEALSRGASHVTFVEPHRDALKTLRTNILSLNEIPNSAVKAHKATALAPIDDPDQAVNYAFLDAPYNQGFSEPALLHLASSGWLGEQAVVMVEIAKDEPLALPPGFATLKEKTYGAARVVFLRFTALSAAAK